MYNNRTIKTLLLVMLFPALFQSCDKKPEAVVPTFGNEFKDTPWLNIEMTFAQPRALYTPPPLPIPTNAAPGAVPVQPASYIPDPVSNVDMILYRVKTTPTGSVRVLVDPASLSLLSTTAVKENVNITSKLEDGDYVLVVRYPVTHRIIRDAVPSVRNPNTTTGVVSIPAAPAFNQVAAQSFRLTFWGVGEYQTFRIDDSFVADLPVTGDISSRDKEIKITKAGLKYTVQR